MISCLGDRGKKQSNTRPARTRGMARPLFGPSIPQNAKACADDEALTKHMPGKPEK